jgi:hypothetical protein
VDNNPTKFSTFRNRGTAYPYMFSYVRSFSHVRLAVKTTFVLSRLCEMGL